MGIVSPDPGLSGEPQVLDNRSTMFGLRAARLFGEHYAWFVDGLYGNIGTSPALADDARTWALRTGFDFYFSPYDDDVSWFATLGGGLLDVDLGAVDSFDRTFGSLGFGFRWLAGDTTSLRLEARADRTIGESGLGGKRLTNALLTFGIDWGVGAPPEDTDGDGVYDRRDQCPATPMGAIVDKRGCPLDEDADGVPDGIDKCPGTPEGWPVDDGGCPLDSDGDGVPDGRDDCAGTPQGATVDDRGCPSDSDSDGVYDGIDKCPDTPQGASVDDRGCPSDSDGDGVLDGLDRCPGTPKGARVDSSGCPMDGDGDGVPDGLDKCPNTAAGVEVDAEGCEKKAPPLFEKGRKTLVLEGVFFEVNSADLSPASLEVLDRVAESLLDWPNVKVEIGGHTDSTGSAAYNKRLSQKRAEAVRQYLISKGVAPERLTAVGYGEEKPIADNKTKEGRARNRRVELRKIR
ncbi:MAG: OmpA family protein [Acidobacteria bacterium]|nr:MAG: OmpA family protein [Acidobacteriota bacterium]